VDRRHHALGTPLLPVEPQREESDRRRMKELAYGLDSPRREVVLRTIREVAADRGWHVWAVHVRSNHVHAVVSAQSVRPEKVLADLKAWASRRLREAFPDDGDEVPGRTRWTQHGSTRYIWDEEALTAAIDYVIDRQGETMAAYRADPRSEPEA
jgi:REP element-mobilizing transposase RayT